jgi:hypothetical protein
VRTNAQEWNAIVASAIEQERDAEGLAESDEAKSRITPVMPPPSWVCATDDGQLTSSTVEEEQFWTDPPRYSLITSLAPPPLTPVPSHRHTWSARLLFATISGAILVLLALELKSFSTRAAPTSTHTSSAVSESP